MLAISIGKTPNSSSWNPCSKRSSASTINGDSNRASKRNLARTHRGVGVQSRLSSDMTAIHLKAITPMVPTTTLFPGWLTSLRPKGDSHTVVGALRHRVRLICSPEPCRDSALIPVARFRSEGRPGAPFPPRFPLNPRPGARLRSPQAPPGKWHCHNLPPQAENLPLRPQSRRTRDDTQTDGLGHETVRAQA
jgi:hypothetical protein